jgi:cell division septation protein DedD
VKFVIAAVVLIGGVALATLLLRSSSNQVVQLEPQQTAQTTNQMASDATPAPTKPAELNNTPKPRPTEPIRPREQPLPPVQSDDLEPVESTAATSRPAPSTPIEETPSTTRTPAATPSKLAVRLEAGSWRLQAGAFRTEDNAVAMKERLDSRGVLSIVVRGEDGIHRVFVGEYFSSSAAKADSERVAELLR